MFDFVVNYMGYLFGIGFNNFIFFNELRYYYF